MGASSVVELASQVDPDIVQSRVIISLSGFENKVFLLRQRSDSGISTVIFFGETADGTIMTTMPNCPTQACRAWVVSGTCPDRSPGMGLSSKR